MNNHPYLVRARQLAICAVVFCAASAVGRAQTITSYGTAFDGTDTVNGAAAAAPYSTTQDAAGTQVLDGQNGWTTNDTPRTGTVGTSTQLVGRSDFVGATDSLLIIGTTTTNSTNQGVVGGVYRTPAGSATGAAPDVVPSTASGGVINLAHAVTIPSTATTIGLSVDFSVTKYTNFAHNDTFSLALQSAAGVPLISFDFSASTSAPNVKDEISTTVGTTTTGTGSQITLNATYRLTLTVNVKADTYTATIVDSQGVTPLNFSGSLAASSVLPTGVGEFSALWNLADKTTGNGGYQNAGDGYIVFDNLAVTVPEPSTYAMMTVGLGGLVGVLRLRQRQA